MREIYSQKGDDQPQQSRRVLEQDREGRRVFTGPDGLEDSLAAHLCAKGLECEIRRSAFKDEGHAQHHIIPGRIVQVRITKMSYAFINRHAAAERENQNRHHQRPEVELFAVSEWMLGVRRFLTLAKAKEEQPVVSGVDQRMNPLGKHC